MQPTAKTQGFSWFNNVNENVYLCQYSDMDNIIYEIIVYEGWVKIKP